VRAHIPPTAPLRFWYITQPADGHPTTRKTGKTWHRSYTLQTLLLTQRVTRVTRDLLRASKCLQPSKTDGRPRITSRPLLQDLLSHQHTWTGAPDARRGKVLELVPTKKDNICAVTLAIPTDPIVASHLRASTTARIATIITTTTCTNEEVPSALVTRNDVPTTIMIATGAIALHNHPMSHATSPTRQILA